MLCLHDYIYVCVFCSICFSMHTSQTFALLSYSAGLRELSMLVPVPSLYLAQARCLSPSMRSVLSVYTLVCVTCVCVCLCPCSLYASLSGSSPPFISVSTLCIRLWRWTWILVVLYCMFCFLCYVMCPIVCRFVSLIRYAKLCLIVRAYVLL